MMFLFSLKGSKCFVISQKVFLDTRCQLRGETIFKYISKSKKELFFCSPFMSVYLLFFGLLFYLYQYFTKMMQLIKHCYLYDISYMKKTVKIGTSQLKSTNKYLIVTTVPKVDTSNIFQIQQRVPHDTLTLCHSSNVRLSF